MSEFIDDDREMPRFRVNRRAMVEPEVLELERREIFDKCWLYVGHESELQKPNDFVTRNLGGRPVIFSRDAKGAVRVWLNSCPHRGAMLCREGEGNARFITCFYHGWSFSNAGELVSVPADEAYGENFERPGLASPAKVDSYRGFVFATFDPEAADLRTYLAGATEYLDLVADQSEVGMQVLRGTHKYYARANWKLLCENSYDGYHASTTHHRYFEMVQAARGGEHPTVKRPYTTTRVFNLGNGHATTHGPAGSEVLFGRELSEAGAKEREERFERLRHKLGSGWVDRLKGSRNMVIFPNLVIIDLVMGVVIRKIDPISPGEMEVTAWEFAPPEEGEELRAQRLDNFLTFWGPGGLASPDDVEALETCQRSFSTLKELPWSDISRGMNRAQAYSNDEFQMRTWWREWNRRITGETLPPEPHDPPEEFFAAPRMELQPEATS